LIRAGESGVGDGPLPEVKHPAATWTFRHFDNQRTGIGQIWESNNIGRAGIWRQDTELVAIGLVADVVQIARAETLGGRLLPFGEADDRQPPNIGLARPLEIEFVLQLADGVLGGEPEIECNLANARVLHALQHGCFLRLCGHCGQHASKRGGRDYFAFHGCTLFVLFR